MGTQDATAVVKEAYAAFGRGDMDGLLAMLTDDITWETPKVEGAPYGGRTVGKSGVAEFFRKMAEAEEILAFEPREFIAQGNRVVAIGRFKGRVRATGREAESTFVHVFTIEGGKCSSFLELFDTAVVMRAYQRAASA
jgi:ketosteroid isomerase-like protein